jgi:murein L,D-transpeptidase YcbB/YkuD
MRRLLALLGTVVMASGLGLVATASPARADYIHCTGYSTYYAFQTKSWVVHSPSRGKQSYNNTCQLKQGDKNDAVKVLQRALKYCRIHANITVDGEFGPATKAAVKDMQDWANARGANLEEDGEFGPLTRDWMTWPEWTWPANKMVGDGYCDFEFNRVY